MKLKPLTESDFPALFDFEKRNWDYFAQFVPARPSAYRQFDTFCIVQTSLLREQKDGKSLFCVGYDEQRLIVRANLHEIEQTTAEVGYRTCQSTIGKGVATAAVAELIDIARQHGLITLTANVSDTNPASERVLVKNGFEYVHTAASGYEHNGVMLNFRYFQRTI